MKANNLKATLFIIGSVILLTAGIVFTVIFCNTYNQPAVMVNADSESEVSYPDVSVRPILEKQYPVTTAPEVEDEPPVTTTPEATEDNDTSVNIQTNAPTTSPTEQAPPPVVPTPVDNSQTTPKTQTDSNGLPLNATDGTEAKGNDGKLYWYDEMNNRWTLVEHGGVVADFATPEEQAEYDAVGHGICPNVVQ